MSYVNVDALILDYRIWQHLYFSGGKYVALFHRVEFLLERKIYYVLLSMMSVTISRIIIRLLRASDLLIAQHSLILKYVDVDDTLLALPGKVYPQTRATWKSCAVFAMY